MSSTPNFKLLILLSLSLLTPSTISLTTTPSNSKCTSFSHTKLKHSTIRFTSLISSGSNFTGDSISTDYNTVQTSLPESCRVACEIQTSGNSSARFEVWLPEVGEWNGRFLAVGNGGWAGGINYPDIVVGLRKGFATMSTDTGHNSTSNDATWTGNSEQMIDFGHRALHLSTLATKELIQTYYHISPSYSYYSGCSTGGRQGWNEAQRYPDDFDGILVGAPANWMTHLPAWDIHVALEQFPNGRESWIPVGGWGLVQKEVVRQCDGIDGVVDGLVSDPDKCNFDPSTLLCPNNSISLNTTIPTCLTTSQITNLKQIYAPWCANDNTTLLYPGLSPGGEAGWSFLFNSATPVFGIDFYRNAILNNTSWDYTTINSSTLQLADSINPGAINAFNPDLRPFRQAGGKILEYHGWQDPIIPSKASGIWYDKVVGFFAGLKGEGENKKKKGEVEDWYRLFMVPGMRHCSGGDGAWVTDSASQSPYLPSSNATDYSLLYSLIKWVETPEYQYQENKEDYTGPERIVGTKYVDDVVHQGVQFTRPFCRWPTIPIYDGIGDVNDERSWECDGKGVY